MTSKVSDYCSGADTSELPQGLPSHNRLSSTGEVDCAHTTITASPNADSSMQASKPNGVKRPSMKKRVIESARAIAENKFFVSFGILLTVWALSGDDFRLLLTNKPADATFDALVVFCIVFFGSEVIIASIGKEDYFMGFFFFLDCISTITLFLDLTVVSNAIFGDGSDENETDKARSSKTARAGARVGRVVRVLRLVRIVKLFKAMQTGAQDKKKAKPLEEGGMEAAWDDEEEPDQQQVHTRESLVGRKLSARTTQRTIIIVLAMLLVLPLLSTESFMRTPASAEYGADDVLTVFNKMQVGNATRKAYEETLLKFIYYHNWFQGSSECIREGGGCSNWFYSQVWWIGIAGEEDTIAIRASEAQIEANDTVHAFDQMAAEQNDLYNYGRMPSEVLPILSSPWTTECYFGGMKHVGISLLGTSIADKVDFAVKCPSDFRSIEIEKFTPRLLTFDEYKDWHFVFYFDLRPFIREESTFNLIKTVFVCIVLCVASLCFSSDANALVLQPVEHMITKVEKIRDNPLAAMKMADDEFKREEITKMKRGKRGTGNPVLDAYSKCCKHNTTELMETVILEKTIIKLGSLLALGFGEAGANIVSHNMKGSSSANVDAMIEGSRVECIVGNARIRDFSIATEVLQGKVMTFVNQVAEIVHGIVDQFHGAVNKNNGDTFLVIWRTAGMTDEQVTKMAEMSIVAFARIVAAVHSSIVLAGYRNHPGLQQRLRDRCRVNLSFGLHCGWAIEGAVGSEFKIDASYLSPNVSIAASIEQATRIYEVCVLVSEAVVQQCTPAMAEKMRLIDKVRIKGSKDPLQLYAVDLDYMRLEVDRPIGPLLWNTQQRYLSRQFLELEKSRKWTTATPVAEAFEACQEIADMRRSYTFEFQNLFCMGYQNYIEGEWKVARTFLLKTQNMLGVKDGPSGALLRFMEAHEFEAPKSWQGFHELGSLDDP